jgi:transcriptional regulator with XRE-family HTH domain
MITDAGIGERVHSECWKRGISQKRLGMALGIAQNTVSAKMRGRRPWGAVELATVAELLGIPVADLIPESRTVPAQWAPWDSNPQPTDFPRRLALVRAA